MCGCILENRRECSWRNGTQPWQGKVGLPRGRNCLSYVAASLPRLLGAKAFQRRDEIRAIQISWQFHAWITSSRT